MLTASLLQNLPYSMSKGNVYVSILMGSESDREVMQPAADILKELKISYDWRVISAHRAPVLLHDYVTKSEESGVLVFIAGAGGAAHLPGVVASFTSRPVIGVPVHTSKLNGLDSLLSIVNMPGGIPVATMSIGSAGAKNAGIMAASMIALKDSSIEGRIREFRRNQTEKMTQGADKSAEIFIP